MHHSLLAPVMALLANHSSALSNVGVQHVQLKRMRTRKLSAVMPSLQLRGEHPPTRWLLPRVLGHGLLPAFAVILLGLWVRHASGNMARRGC